MRSFSFASAILVSLFVSGAGANSLFSLFLFEVRGGGIPFVVVDPPPPVGGEIDLTDFRELHYWQQNRTRAQCDAAAREVNLFLRSFLGSRNDLLSPREEMRLTKDVSMLQLQVLRIAMDMKNRFVRRRPYIVDKTLKPCLPPENSAAYPSAHAATAYAMAEALGAVFPNRKNIFLERAQEVAFNRMMGGVHHRTDLIAGEKLGRYYGQRARLHSGTD